MEATKVVMAKVRADEGCVLASFVNEEYADPDVEAAIGRDEFFFAWCERRHLVELREAGYKLYVDATHSVTHRHDIVLITVHAQDPWSSTGMAVAHCLTTTESENEYRVLFSWLFREAEAAAAGVALLPVAPQGDDQGPQEAPAHHRARAARVQARVRPAVLRPAHGLAEQHRGRARRHIPTARVDEGGHRRREGAVQQAHVPRPVVAFRHRVEGGLRPPRRQGPDGKHRQPRDSRKRNWLTTPAPPVPSSSTSTSPPRAPTSTASPRRPARGRSGSTCASTTSATRPTRRRGGGPCGPSPR